MENYKKSPSLLPYQPFDPNDDARHIYTAFHGMKINKKAIIHIIARRTNAQRLKILESYQQLYKKDLVDKFKKKFKGDFKNLMISLMIPTMPDYYVQELRYATEGFGTVEDILIGILCILSNDEVQLIKKRYTEVYGKTLESDIKGDTSGVFSRLLIALCMGARDDGELTDPEAAKCSAEKLYERGIGRPGTDESVFIRVFCFRNFPQLKLIFKYLEEISGKDVETAIKQEFSGDCEQIFLAIIQLVNNPPAFFARRLYESMRGLGTNDRRLIRLVITRSEIDMNDIKKEYVSNYGESLADSIKGDCSGSYQQCLLTLIGDDADFRKISNGCFPTP